MPRRGPDWSRFEVEATVAAYFRMLEAGLRGEPFNKTEHRRALLPLLANRPPGAVERKHQNISAILLEENLPYITGYKPLGNYQRLLREIVLEQLANRMDIQGLVLAEVQRVPSVPTVDDILAVFTAPPEPRPWSTKRYATPRRPATVDFLQIEARNRELGLAGEKFVMALEQARLEAAGHGRLAASISHVSLQQGDGPGYDILSFDEDTRERLIEVKTTKFGEYTPFYASRNEVEVSREMLTQYHLYRLYSFGPEPRLFTKRGSLDEGFVLDVSTYRARVG
jgi:hypothetical protein